MITELANDFHRRKCDINEAQTHTSDRLRELCGKLNDKGYYFEEFSSLNDKDRAKAPDLVVYYAPDKQEEVKAIINIFVFGRNLDDNKTENSVNIARLTTFIRDKWLDVFNRSSAADGTEAINRGKAAVFSAVIFPCLDKESFLLNPLNRAPDLIMFKKGYERVRRDAEELLKYLDSITESTKDNASGKPLDNSVITEVCSWKNLFESHASETAAQDMLCGCLKESILLNGFSMRSFHIEDSKNADYVILIKSCGFVVVEIKNWGRGIQYSKEKDYFYLSENDRRGNPVTQADVYVKAIIKKLMEKQAMAKEDAEKIVKKAVFFAGSGQTITEDEFKADFPDYYSRHKSELLFAEDVDSNDPSKLEAFLIGLFGENPHLRSSAFYKCMRFMDPQYKEAHSDSIRYSVLKSWSEGEVDEAKAEKAVKSWFTGTKQINIVKTAEEFEILKKAAAEGLEKRGIGWATEETDGGTKNDYQNLVFLNDKSPNGSIDGAVSEYPDGERCLELFRFRVILDKTAPDFEITDGNTGNLSKAAEDYLKKSLPVNYQQFRVEHSPANKHLKVIAGAGTGKTYSLVSRVAYLCSECSGSGVTDPSEQIAMLTFTNKAAEVMRERLKKMFFSLYILTGDSVNLRRAENLQNMKISTIHSFFKDIISCTSTAIGIGSDFSVTSSKYDYGKIFRKRLSEKLDGKNPDDLQTDGIYTYRFLNTVEDVGYDLFVKGLSFDDVFNNNNTMKLYRREVNNNSTPVSVDWSEITTNNELKESIRNAVIDTNSEYAKYLKKHNMILLEQYAEKAKECIDSAHFNPRSFGYKQVIIDEFQDTDTKQIETISELCKKCGFTLTVVGDPNQSIYGFRGADANAFNTISDPPISLSFEEVFLTINRRTDIELLKMLGECTKDKNNTPYGSLIPGGIIPEPVGIKNSPLQANGDTVQTIIKESNDDLSTVLGKIKRDIQGDPYFDNRNVTVGILVRDRSEIITVQEAGVNAGIDIAVLDDDNAGDLYRQPAATDLFLLLSALMHPDQPLYLFALINSGYFDLRVKKDNASYDFTEFDNMLSGLKFDIDDLIANGSGGADKMNNALRTLGEYYNKIEKEKRNHSQNTTTLYFPLDLIGKNSPAERYEALKNNIDQYLEKIGMPDWESIRRRVTNQSAPADMETYCGDESALKLIQDFYFCCCPWKNSPCSEENYRADYNLIFNELISESRGRMITLEGLYESMYIKVIKKASSRVSSSHSGKNNGIVFTCMTIHKAKGLEFDYVLLINYPENQAHNNNNERTISGIDINNHEYRAVYNIGTAPDYANDPNISINHFLLNYNADQYGKNTKTGSNDCEEKRILYVALTRAIHKIYIHNIEPNDPKGEFRNNSWQNTLNI